MIPCVVELTDFLSHRCADGEPVVFDFEGAVLWSVAGDNGAGKSAVFDAITWALYGQHRGGTQEARRLISHGAGGCRVGFVFALAGERYRVERTLRTRGGARRSASRWDDSRGAWDPIPGTTSDKGFDSWRDGLIGLSYSAFTQSVLLIQGGSDRLIASGAKERFDILAQLVDLSAYQRFEERARARAAEARGRRQALAAELQRLTPVDPAEREAAELELKRLSAERDARRSEWQAQVAVLDGARNYSALLERIVQLDVEIAAKQSLLAEGERIRAEAAECKLLSTAREHLDAGIAALAAAAEAQAGGAASSEELDGVDLGALDGAVATAGEQAQIALGASVAAATRAGALRHVASPVETAIQRALEQLAAEEIAVAVGSAANAADELERAVVDLADLVAEAEERRGAERDEERSTANIRAAAEAAESTLERVREGVDEAVCTRCGQTVPGDRRAEHLAHLEEDLSAKTEALSRATDSLGLLTEARSEADAAVAAKRDQVAALERTVTRAADAERAVDVARDASATARENVSDWGDPRASTLTDADHAGLQALRSELQRELHAAEAEESELAAAARAAETAVTDAAEALSDAEKSVRDLELQVQELEYRHAAEHRRAEIELEHVPKAWASRALQREDRLIEALTERLGVLEPAVAAAAELDSAEAGLVSAGAARCEVTTRIDAIPADQRLAVADAEDAVERHRVLMDDAQVLVDEAAGQIRDLDQRERLVGALRADVGGAQREEHLANRLAELLGRRGIQGQIIVRAAHGLEQLANETLHAISGGTLAVEISAEERRGRDEIVISVRDFNCGGEVTDASFLSGSEKFRVCVAMAAAIGKYASAHTAIESLIIDEGFGSLDETRRDEMIDELQRLALLLERVIVVSHQGEFHDRARFPHGYRLRRAGGVTEVQRFV